MSDFLAVLAKILVVASKNFRKTRNDLKNNKIFFVTNTLNLFVKKTSIKKFQTSYKIKETRNIIRKLRETLLLRYRLFNQFQPHQNKNL